MPFTEELKVTTQALVRVGKGILAADESLNTENQRFEKLGIPQTIEMRQEWRRVLFTTPGIGAYLSGVILFDETIYQATQEGVLFTTILQDAGIIPGIKLDKGIQPFVGRINERITDGLDGLRDRIAEYYRLGARLAMNIWMGQESNVRAAQEEFFHRAQLNSLASIGQYNSEMETVVTQSQISSSPSFLFQL